MLVWRTFSGPAVADQQDLDFGGGSIGSMEVQLGGGEQQAAAFKQVGKLTADPTTRGNRMARGEAFRYVTDAACRAGELGPQLIRLAELDVRAAENFYAAAQVWHSDCCNPIAHDSTLLKFLAVVYLSKLLLGREEELEACALSLKGLVTMQELKCVLGFAAGLVTERSLALERLCGAVEDDQELASVFLERRLAGSFLTWQMEFYVLHTS